MPLVSCPRPGPKAVPSCVCAADTEKPISHDPEELMEIIELAESTRLPFMVGYQRRIDKVRVCEPCSIAQLRRKRVPSTTWHVNTPN